MPAMHCAHFVCKASSKPQSSRYKKRKRKEKRGKKEKKRKEKKAFSHSLVHVTCPDMHILHRAEGWGLQVGTGQATS